MGADDRGESLNRHRLRCGEVKDRLVDGLQVVPIEEVIEGDRLDLGHRTPFPWGERSGGSCPTQSTFLFGIGRLEPTLDRAIDDGVSVINGGDYSNSATEA